MFPVSKTLLVAAFTAGLGLTCGVAIAGSLKATTHEPKAAGATSAEWRSRQGREPLWESGATSSFCLFEGANKKVRSLLSLTSRSEAKLGIQ